MQWKVRIMTRPDFTSTVRIMFLEADSFEEAKKQVPLADNHEATFETLEEDYARKNKPISPTVSQLLSKE